MRHLPLSMLMTVALACGETGDTTATASTQATTDEATTTSGTDTTTEAATATEPATEPTSGTAGASESSTTSDTTTTSTTAAETADATTAVDTTTGDTTTTTTTGETTTDTTGDTTDTTGGTSPLVIAIVDAYLTADCMPIADPDPVQGGWYVEFDNTDNPNDTSAVVIAASLSLDADPLVVEPIMVQPIESPPIAAGAYESLEMAKLPGAMHSACEHCDEFYKLVLEYDEGGVKHHVEEDVTISCSF
ncbi:hypothetical protein [Nannocystis pusilla]|uniref:Lipoprotein n=1 Tax=Nannocystis pusilla TaxID=889268 RepID=A0ABS7U6E9_9BACT|nr:hypothetical protein [Nannocystis pusilla]MBZ5716075.1 hypothetical protein [Nannocystis pusilla]